LLETFVLAALAEERSDNGVAARSIGGLVPLTADVLRDVDPDFRADLLMVVEHFTHSAMTFVVQGYMSIEDVYPQLERTVHRLAQHPAMAAHRPAAWGWVAEPRARGEGVAAMLDADP
jgi:hypothetical protein